MKLKKYMKGISKEAVSGCAIRHRERRAYLREQVKALAALVGAEPGMLGPKLPMVRNGAGRDGERLREGGKGGGGATRCDVFFYLSLTCLYFSEPVESCVELGCALITKANHK